MCLFPWQSTATKTGEENVNPATTSASGSGTNFPYLVASATETSEPLFVRVNSEESTATVNPAPSVVANAEPAGAANITASDSGTSGEGVQDPSSEETGNATGSQDSNGILPEGSTTENQEGSSSAPAASSGAEGTSTAPDAATPGPSSGSSSMYHTADLLFVCLFETDIV